MPRTGEERPHRKSHRNGNDRRHRDHQQRYTRDRDSRDSGDESSNVNPYLESPSMGGGQPSRFEGYLEGSVALDGFRPSDASTEDNTSSTSSYTALEELQRLCDMASNPISWDAVRSWFRVHSASDARQAAERRGDYDTVPLHLACRNNPPADVIKMLLIASPEMVRAADSFGWLPLHYACANDASEEVLTLLVTDYPESVTSVDKRKRTPLHFALGRAERPAERGVVLLLSETGAALFPDENGMLPLHYACAYGATEEALRVLTDDNIMTITATDVRGRTPLHFALGNADRPASPAVVRLLLSQNPAVVDSIDKMGDLALHLLATRSQAIPEYETEKRLNCQKCLGYYLEANPRPTAGLLMALQSLPTWLRDIAVVNPVVQRFLNTKISKTFPTAVIFVDFVCYILVIVFFQMAVIDSISDLANAENDEMIIETNNLNKAYLGVLYFAAVHFFFREFFQAVSLATLGLFSTWLFDATNWFDIAYIILILFWSICMEKQLLSLHSFQVGAAITVMVFWVNVLLFLKGIMVGFAVFVGGVVYVVKRLAAFFLALLIILLSFAQIFYTIFRMTGDPNDKESGCSSTYSSFYISQPWEPAELEVCAVGDSNDCVIVEPDSCEPNNSNPWCSFWTSFYKTYSMLLGEVDDDDFAGSRLATFFFCLYMFGVVIVLANVLIAIVTDSYSVIKNERAAVVFWSNRLDFVAEMDVIGSHVHNRCKRFINTDDSNWEERLGEIWNKFMYLFDDTEQRRHHGISPEFIVFNVLRVGIVCVVIPLWIILGAVTVGLLWPPQVREYLLTSQLTRASKKGEEDAARLENVARLRQDVSAFHQELKDDIDKAREELSNIRMFLSDTKLGISREMKDLTRIVNELYENTLD